MGGPTTTPLCSPPPDELIGAHRVSDETYRRLNAVLSTEQLIELLFLVGNYTMLAGFLHSLDVTFDGLDRRKACLDFAARTPSGPWRCSPRPCRRIISADPSEIRMRPQRDERVGQVQLVGESPSRRMSG